MLIIIVPLWKKAILHTTTLMHCKARQVLRDLFSTYQGNDSDMTYVAGTTKINLKNLQNVNLWQILAEVLLELELKSIKIILAYLSNKLTQNLFNTCDHIIVCITLLLPTQKFNITKIMVLIFSIIVMVWYLYSACLVGGVLKGFISKNTFQGTLLNDCFQIQYMRYREQYLGI